MKKPLGGIRGEAPPGAGKIVPPQGGSGTAPPSKPYTSNAATSATKTAPATCGDCKHWKTPGERTDDPMQYGLCLLNPPSIVSLVTDIGPRCNYPVTAGSYPACSRGEK